MRNDDMPAEVNADVLVHLAVDRCRCRHFDVRVVEGGQLLLPVGALRTGETPCGWCRVVQRCAARVRLHVSRCQLASGLRRVSRAAAPKGPPRRPPKPPAGCVASHSRAALRSAASSRLSPFLSNCARTFRSCCIGPPNPPRCATNPKRHERDQRHARCDCAIRYRELHFHYLTPSINTSVRSSRCRPTLCTPSSLFSALTSALARILRAKRRLVGRLDRQALPRRRHRDQTPSRTRIARASDRAVASASWPIASRT